MRRLTACGVALVALLIGASSAGAETFVVTFQGDGTICVPGMCALRGAVLASNSAGGTNTILVPPGDYTMSGTGDDAAAFGDIDVTKGAVTIIGTAGAAATRVHGSTGMDRIFDVPAASTTASLTLSGLTIEGGRGVQQGAGVEDDHGTLTLTDDVFTDNLAGDQGAGGGVYYGPDALTGNELTVSGSTFTANTAANISLNGSAGGAIAYGAASGSGAMTVTNSTFAQNVARNHTAGNGGIGGAISFDAGVGSLTVVGSTFTGNAALTTGTQGDGGAIWFGPETDAGSTLSVTNSTLDANMASAPVPDGTGGAIFAEPGVDTTTLTNDTVAGNTATAPGGGGAVDDPAPLLPANTIFADNTAGGVPNTCSHAVASTSGSSRGFNLAPDSSCGLSAIGDSSANPQLQPLADNGGPTQTMALGAGSGALDKILAGNCPATDQRGVARPQGPLCDIGALEQIPAPPIAAVVPPVVPPVVPISVPPPSLPAPKLTVASRYVHHADGSVTVSATVNRAGTVRVHGTGTAKATSAKAKTKNPKPKPLVASVTRTVTKASTVTLTIKPSAAGKAALKRKPSLGVRLTFTFTAQGVSAAKAISKTKSVSLKLTKPKRRASGHKHR